MRQANISEIFQSIQGEGKYAGAGQVFVRFFECNMRCAWCDTPHSTGDTSRGFEKYSLDELWQKIRDLWENCHSISLTGGEPLVQKDFIKTLLPRIKKSGVLSYLETNGILYEALAEVIEDIDIIAMDFKLPSSTKCRPFWREHKAFLKVACRKEVFIKAVISSDTKRDEVLQSVDLVAEVDPEVVYILQPNYFDRENGVMQKCLEYQKDCSKHLKDVRIIPQMHKLMKIR